MGNSSLISAFYMADQGNFTGGRNGHNVEMITIHHCGGVLNAKQIGAIFQTPGRYGSSHYGVGVDGDIAQFVWEDDTAWTNSDWDANCKAITIETSNDRTGGDWHVSDASLSSLIKLVADIAKRNNLGTLVPGKNLTWHSMYANTTCLPINTELLTKNGWKKLKDVEIGEEIACADLDNLKITFEEVYDKVLEKKQDTYTNNGLTATKDHRMVYFIQNNKQEYRVDYYKNLLSDNNNYYIPMAGYSDFDGLELSDDMIKFYIATQADGSYMYETLTNGEKSYYGLEFHFKKQRKIERLLDVLNNLNLEYSINKKADESITIRIYNQNGVNIVKDICEKYLKDKQFTWNWLYLNKEQAKLFLEEIKLWDGCLSGNYYSSSKKQNLDVISAIAAINGIGSNAFLDKVIFRENPYMTLSNENTKRNKSGELQNVSCVSVKTGIILIRQHGKTFIVGNCPGPYLLSKINYVADEANKINGQGLTIEEIERKSIVLNESPTYLWNLSYANPDEATPVKEYACGTRIDNIVAIAHHPMGRDYYITEYSYNNGVYNGFNVSDGDDYIEDPKELSKEEQKPAIKEEPKEEPKKEEPVEPEIKPSDSEKHEDSPISQEEQKTSSDGKELSVDEQLDKELEKIDENHDSNVVLFVFKQFFKLVELIINLFRKG